MWGQRHKRFLKEHHKVRYYNLLTAGRLNSYLVDIEKQAEDMFEQAVKLLVEKEGVAEKLKVNSPMEWVQKINNIRNRATNEYQEFSLILHQSFLHQIFQLIF